MLNFDIKKVVIWKRLTNRQSPVARVPLEEHVGKHREANRETVLKPASIEFDGEVIPCMVRNISPAGAMIDTAKSAALPAEFVLSLLFDSRRKSCRVVWRRENRLGVEFE